MGSANLKLKRREAHSAYQKMRTEYRARRVGKTIEINPEDIADPATNLLRGPNLKNGLKVYIPKWDNLPPPTAPEKIEVLFDRGNGRLDIVADHEFVIPSGENDFQEVFPYEMLINVNNLPQDATCLLTYCHHTYQNDEVDSPIMVVVCDQVPPYKYDPPLALTFVAEHLDDSNLSSGEELVATIPGYPDWQATDKIAIYLVDAADIPEDPTSLTPIFVKDVPAPGVTDTSVNINGDLIRAFGDSECAFLYVLTDKATNSSAISIYKKMSLTFGGLPDNLQPPEVPQADPGPLTVEHALAGVSVWIPKYDNPKAKDYIRLKWGDTLLDDYPVGPNPQDKIEIPVFPIATLLLEYGLGTTGNKITNVSYQIIRNGRPFGPKDANIEVNFEVAIPWIPFPPIDWPNPGHPSLLKGEVKNFDGTRTNELIRADKDRDVTFSFTWYTEAVNGHIVDFFWNGTCVVEAQITFDDKNSEHVPGRWQTVDIPWQYIEDGGNGQTVPVHYQVSAAGLVNDLLSDTTEVSVNAIAIELPPASFPTIPNPASYSGCQVLENDGSLQVAIPDLSGLLENGDEIRVVFTPMRGEDLSAGEDPITGARFTKSYEIGTDWPVTGFTILVEPYTTHILPLYDENVPSRRGRAKIQYFFNDGTEAISSTPLTILTAFHRPNDPCEIPRP